ncbi:hypothetical protein E2C01_056018 [Portunus trituberculatus]|uniref:Uncharacterized protein n=1 Tax=Portunus trituberculatus TaxID=210409 RepID=A0A5B7GP84_PORTR|nr:hypothetical protein [Portunus trituberculatus]
MSRITSIYNPLKANERREERSEEGIESTSTSTNTTTTTTPPWYHHQLLVASSSSSSNSFLGSLLATSLFLNAAELSDSTLSKKLLLELDKEATNS